MQSLTQSDLLILMSFSGSFNLASSGFLIAPFLIQFNNSIMSDSCYPMDCSMPGFPVHHQHPELAQTHIHQVGDAIQPSQPLLSPSPPAFNLSQVFSNESVLCIRWPKYWGFIFSISPSNECSGYHPTDMPSSASLRRRSEVERRLSEEQDLTPRLMGSRVD